MARLVMVCVIAYLVLLLCSLFVLHLFSFSICVPETSLMCLLRVLTVYISVRFIVYN